MTPVASLNVVTRGEKVPNDHPTAFLLAAFLKKVTKPELDRKDGVFGDPFKLPNAPVAAQRDIIIRKFRRVRSHLENEWRR